MTSTLFYGYF